MGVNWTMGTETSPKTVSRLVKEEVRKAISTKEETSLGGSGD